MTGVFNVKKSAIWHAIAPIYGATTVITMDMLPWIAQIKYHCLAHQHATGLMPTTGMIDPPLDIIATPDILTVITRINPGSAHSWSHSCNHRYRSSSHHDSHRSHSRSFHRPSQHSFSCHRSSSSYCYCCTTHHTTDLHLIGILPEMTADLDTNPKNNTTNQHKDPHPPHKQHLGSIRIRDTSRSPLMTLHQNTTAQMIMIVTQRMI